MARVLDPPASPASPGPASSGPATAGRVLARRYVLVRRLASGGMAEVWEATDEVLERPVAVKVLHPHLSDDEVFRLRFRGEAIAAARLRHPSIISIYDTCHDDGLEAIVMELARSRTLREYLDERSWLSTSDVVRIGADVSDALEVAHRAGVVHRDVKPANILLCDDGRVVVTDFGIAKVRDEADLTSTGAMIGTAKYLSPEQVEGAPVDARSDVYSLGVVLYEAICGQPPFESTTPAATALARLHQPPLPLASLRPDVPSALADTVLRALERWPDHRFQHASDLRAALLAGGGGAGGGAPLPDHDRTVVAAVPHGPEPSLAPGPVAAATGAAHASAAPPGPPEAPPDRRRWLFPLLFLGVVAASVALAFALLTDTEVRPRLPAGLGGDDAALTGEPVEITGVTILDPAGDGEHDDERLRILDGDPSTAWRTETYQSPDWSGAKDGVGLALQLGEPTRLGELTVTSALAGWSGEVYVADQVAELGAWGEPVATLRSVGPEAVAELDGAEGGAVLLWLTETGGPPHRVEIAEVVLTG